MFSVTPVTPKTVVARHIYIYIYIYTVQVEFCYNVANMCRASSSLVELCSLQCVLSK